MIIITNVGPPPFDPYVRLSQKRKHKKIPSVIQVIMKS